MPTAHESRRVLLDAIGPAPDLTFIRPHGNIGDELIWAGARELLSGHVYREIGVDDLPTARGELAVIGGGGAWCRTFNAYMPEVLAIAELRFERVILLPSSFDIRADRVRAALERSRALVFARELESFARIRGFCSAGLAHDLAFFADLSAFDDPGDGSLDAFRTDEERPGGDVLPTGNIDLSAECGSLDEWLRTIERHREINTNRAHVMIAAALMGKRVRYASSGYFKVDAIAESCLGQFDVAPLAEASSKRRAGPGPSHIPSRSSIARVTIAVVARDDFQTAVHASERADSADCDADVTIFDRNSVDSVRNELSALATEQPNVELRLADRDLGAGGAAKLASEISASEYVLFLDRDTRLHPGALDRLVATLDADPAAWAAAPTVVSPSGETLHCGCWPETDAETIRLEPSHAGADADALASLPASPTGWVPIIGSLFRGTALRLVSPAEDLDADCQSADWCLRAADAGATLAACPAAVVEWAGERRPPGTDFAERAHCVLALGSYSRFFERHGRLMIKELEFHVPDLSRLPAAERPAAAALLLAYLDARGPERTLLAWMSGRFESLFGEPEAEREVDLERLDWLERRSETLTAIEGGGWWRLRGRLMPLRRAAKTLRGVDDDADRGR